MVVLIIFIAVLHFYDVFQHFLVIVHDIVTVCSSTFLRNKHIAPMEFRVYF
jgi:hypothetical protein